MVWDIPCFEDNSTKDESLNELMNDGGVCRTATGSVKKYFADPSEDRGCSTNTAWKREGKREGGRETGRWKKTFEIYCMARGQDTRYKIQHTAHNTDMSTL